MSTTSLDCAKHPGVSGPFTCSHCGQNFCVNCCYSMPDNTVACHDCYARTAAAPAATAAVAAQPSTRLRVTTAAAPVHYQEPVIPGQGCLQHPNVPGIYKCSFCGAKSCITCDFYFLPDTHACPQCAATSSGRLSPARKKNMVGSLISGGIATVVMAIFFSGVVDMETGAGPIIAEVLFRLILFPSAVGAGLAMAAFKKGRSNTIGIWIALVWNYAVMIGVFAISIIGLFALGGE